MGVIFMKTICFSTLCLSFFIFLFPLIAFAGQCATVSAAEQIKLENAQEEARCILNHLDGNTKNKLRTGEITRQDLNQRPELLDKAKKCIHAPVPSCYTVCAMQFPCGTCKEYLDCVHLYCPRF